MRASSGIWLLGALIGSLFGGCVDGGSSRISPPQVTPGGRFGSAVAAAGSTGMIGSPGHNQVGAVYVLDLEQNNEILAEILPEAANDGDDFGSSIGFDETVLVIGAPLHEHGGFIAGAAFVYGRGSTGEWVEQAILASETPGDLDYFASSISLNGDRVALGSPGDDGLGANSGAAYVFADPHLGWALQEKIFAPDGGPGDRCGTSVVLNGDRILVGCPYGFGSEIQSGTAYLYRHSGAGFELEHKFNPSSTDTGQLFGSAVEISGNTVFVGAPGFDEERPDGSVHIFESQGGTWAPAGVLSAGDRVASRGFGAVLNLDDDLLAVGAQRMEGDHLAPGSVFVFTRSGGEWTLQSRLVGNDVDRADGFGSSVAVDDGHVLVGAAGDAEGGSNAGAAYHFRQSGTSWN